ncbi:MAG TPA: hypothetical protein VII02_14375 [Gemmatimonadaceae bacterium]
MKRLALTLGAVAMAATTITAVPTSATAQTGCSWWDLTCNGLAQTVIDYGWHMTGRDQTGNVVYLRRVVDANGNVVFEQARRNDIGRYVVVNNHVIRKGTVYGPNGEICKYSSNDKGYKEECKYAKAYKPYNVPKVKPVKPVHYEAPKAHPGKYEPPKVHTGKYNAPKVESNHPGGFDVKAAKGAKPPEGKDEAKAAKGPKH